MNIKHPFAFLPWDMDIKKFLSLSTLSVHLTRCLRTPRARRALVRATLSAKRPEGRARTARGRPVRHRLRLHRLRSRARNKGTVTWAQFAGLRAPLSSLRLSRQATSTSAIWQARTGRYSYIVHTFVSDGRCTTCLNFQPRARSRSNSVLLF